MKMAQKRKRESSMGASPGIGADGASSLAPSAFSSSVAPGEAAVDVEVRDKEVLELPVTSVSLTTAAMTDTGPLREGC